MYLNLSALQKIKFDALFLLWLQMWKESKFSLTATNNV